MSIIKRDDGTLVFFNAIPLDEGAMAEICAWGKPTDLILGHHQHCIDAEPFREHLSLRAYGPKANQVKLRERVDLSGTFEEFPNDESIKVASVPGTKLGEAVVFVKSGPRLSILFSDVIQNNPPENVPTIFRF